MEELLKEKQDLEAKIAAKQKEAEAATTHAYWLRKRMKLIEAQIKAMEEKNNEDTTEKATLGESDNAGE